MINKHTGFILNSKPYKEYDGLVNVYLEEGVVKTFLYKGLFRPKSKRVSTSLPFVEYEFTYLESQSLLIPREISIKNKYITLQDALTPRIVGQIINRIFLFRGDILNYPLYQWAISTLNTLGNPILVLILIMVEDLIINGFSPYMDGDVITKDTKVNHFDIELGGLLYKPHVTVYSIEELKLLRKLFKSTHENYSIIKHVELNNKVLDTIVQYYQYHTDLELKGVSLLTI